MEIINPNTPGGDTTSLCSSDILAPEHTCYNGGGNPGCIGYSVFEMPCFDYY